MPFVLPPPLSPGDTVAVFAGSSPFDATLVWRGMGWLRARYQVVFERAMFTRTGFLAGSDERRARELQRLLDDASVKAVIAARGGYGLSRILPVIDLHGFTQRPKWIVGFSDVTALHLEAQRAGVASLHGPNVAGVGRGDGVTRDLFLRALEAPGEPNRLQDLTSLAPGNATGPLIGGNLTLLHATAAAGRLVIPDGAILLVEDVTERPYRIDRMLTTLIDGGHLARVAGVLVGSFTDCTAGLDGVGVEEVLRERLGGLRVPVLAGARIGHGRWNVPVVLGATWSLDGARLEARC